MRISLLAIAILFVGTNAIASSFPEMTVCYIPFDAQTFIPVTMDDIGNRCVLTKKLTKSEKFERVAAYLQNATVGEFDGDMVRVRITYSDGKKVYIDSSGGIASDNGTRHLDSKSYEKVKKLIEELVGER